MIEWRKVDRRGLLRTHYVGFVGSRELLSIWPIVLTHARNRRSVTWKLVRTAHGEVLGVYATLNEAKHQADFLVWKRE